LSRRDLPEYVERGGAQVWRPPYSAKHADVFGFMLATDPAAIDRLLQRDLVEPSFGAVDYRAAFEYLIVLVADIGLLSCADPPDSLRGFLPEREVGVWCLGADAQRAGRLVWYLPYVFTDSGQTVATGREVYGYAKQIGIFDDDFPAKLTDGGVTTVKALANNPYDPQQRAAVLPMISVEALQAPPQGPLGDLAAFTGLFSGAIHVRRDVPSGPPPEPSAAITASDAPAPPSATPPQPWVRRVLDRFIRGGLQLAEEGILIADMVANPTLVFLKQFRDISCSTKACYQAVTEAPLGVEPISYRPLDAADFRITVQDWASHPIASELGLPAGTPIEPVHAFRASLNFQIRLGYEVWRAQA
jgi:hypothetical protein